jgi:dihydrofolate synthase / folylpolyglutamate synthase
MTADEYADVVAWLYALDAAKGMDFKLERVMLALKNLGDPHRAFPVVHVAGTNGKGSVAAMLHAMFRAGGYRVGLYTSPHLVSLTERIRVGDHLIGEADVVTLAREIRTAATVCGIELTFFEFLTVMAFLHFARCRVDMAVVEVGLGGRLDATNVVDPSVAVITTIGLDHEEFLGNTLASVAHEKAGIIKPGRPVVIGKVTEDVRALLVAIAGERGAPPSCWGHDFTIETAAQLSGLLPDLPPGPEGRPEPARREAIGEGTQRPTNLAFQFKGMGVDLADLAVGLRGAYQRDNAATAIATALQVRRTLPLSDAAVRDGLAAVRWPGRLDVVHDAPLVLLDGAHNADGVHTLVRELPEIIGSRQLHVLFGVMRDKHWPPMVQALGPRVATATLATPLASRGEAAEALARAFEPYCPVRIAAHPLDGLQSVLRSARADDAILVTGSLFLVGAVYPYFLRTPGLSSLFGAAAATQHP